MLDDDTTTDTTATGSTAGSPSDAVPGSATGSAPTGGADDGPASRDPGGSGDVARSGDAASADVAGSGEVAGTADVAGSGDAVATAPAAAAAPAKRAARKTSPRKTAASRRAAVSVAPGEDSTEGDAGEVPPSSDPSSEEGAAPARKAAAKTAAKKITAKKPAAKKAPAKRAAGKKAAAAATAPEDAGPATPEPAAAEEDVAAREAATTTAATGAIESSSTQEPTGSAPTSLLFQAPDATAAPARRRRKAAAPAPAPESDPAAAAADPAAVPADDTAGDDDAVAPGTASVGSDEPAAHVDETDVGTSTGEDTDDPTSTTDTDTGTDTGTDDGSDTGTDDGSDTGRDDGSDADDSDADDGDTDDSDTDADDDTDDAQDAGDDAQAGGGNRRRRRRGGRRRRRSGGGGSGADDDSAEDGESATSDDSSPDDQEPSADAAPGGRRQGGSRAQRGRNGTVAKEQGDQGQQDQAGGDQEQDRSEPDDEGGQGEGSSRRRRRRRRTGEDGDAGEGGDGGGTVVRVRKPRNAEDEITSLHGSTRLEAKKQRRREGREAGRRRAPIVSEAEFLARRESVDRVMVMRQNKDLTQIAVLEDKVLVEHYVARESQTSLIGNVYLGRVQNVLPSMEAAFIDIGKGRNAVLYAGEVNWSALGAGNGPRKIEQVLKSGQPILVQVSKDPVGHKGARLTSQVSLPGRFLVYVPDGTTSGISRRLPDTERTRLKTLLKEIVPDTAGVIVRTAAEGASEEELRLDVERLTSRWAEIEAKIEKASGNGGGPQLLYGEPDLTLKVVRDLFTEDFGKLVVSGDDAWDLVDGYVKQVAPDLEERLERYDGEEDVFAAYRVDEQIAKGLDRKVWLPSGGSLVIDRTEAMTVVDVNTGKFTGSGGNLEETVTKNNLEAAEEIVRQLRLRDIGGIIVVDFIDMVLESNRDLVLRRLVECLGRDRTRHQVAEVTSLGLVQMTRKRIGTGLLEAFSENCDHCQGRGVVVHVDPVEPRRQPDEEPRRGGRRGRGRGEGGDGGQAPAAKAVPTPKDLAAMPRHEARPAVESPADDVDGAVLPGTAGPVAPAGPQVTSLPSTGTTDATDPASAPVPLPTSDAPDDVTDWAATPLPLPAPDAPDAGSVPLRTDAPAEADATASPGTAVGRGAGDGPGTLSAGSPREAGVVGVDAEAAAFGPGPAADPAGAATAGTGDTSSEQAADEPASGPAAETGAPAAGAPETGAPAAETVASQPEAPVVPAGPRLVTSTRRRVVRRPAGPPTSAANGGSVPGTDGGHGGALVGAGADPEEGPPGLDVAEEAAGSEPVHVPVKKRGRRR